MTAKRPKHEDGTCGYEVLRKRESDGLFMPVVLEDSLGHCPGDPMCAYTELARIQARVDQQPAMERARRRLHQGLPLDGERIRDEWLYELVCIVKNIEPRAAVQGMKWPITPDSLGGNSEYIDWPRGGTNETA